MEAGEDRGKEVEERDDERPPEPNGDLGSWLYVLCGIPGMILFFVLYFGLIGSCDATNVMISG